MDTVSSAQATPTRDAVTAWAQLRGEPQMHRGEVMRALPPASMDCLQLLPLLQESGSPAHLMQTLSPEKHPGAQHSGHCLQLSIDLLRAIGPIKTSQLNPQIKLPPALKGPGGGANPFFAIALAPGP